MRSKSHKDVEFAVKLANGEDKYVKTFDEAASLAVAVALSRGSSRIDVIVSSASGARWVGGDDAVEQYKFDPETSVFQRIAIKADDLGRIP